MAESVTFLPQRSIGGFTANVTVEEAGTDTLAITEHPVEQGAAITDHSYVNQPQLAIRAGWSNSSPEAAGDEQYVQSIYDQLLALQQSREPFDIVTGKRAYSNMLFASLAQTTDEKSEFALLVTASFLGVIIVQTQATAVPPAANQANPEQTSATSNAGTKQPVPAPQANTSALASLFGASP